MLISMSLIYRMRVGRFPKAVFYPAALITLLPTPNQSYFSLRQTAH